MISDNKKLISISGILYKFWQGYAIGKLWLSYTINQHAWFTSVMLRQKQQVLILKTADQDFEKVLIKTFVKLLIKAEFVPKTSVFEENT